MRCSDRRSPGSGCRFRTKGFEGRKNRISVFEPLAAAAWLRVQSLRQSTCVAASGSRRILPQRSFSRPQSARERAGLKSEIWRENAARGSIPPVPPTASRARLRAIDPTRLLWIGCRKRRLPLCPSRTAEEAVSRAVVPSSFLSPICGDTGAVPCLPYLLP